MFSNFKEQAIEYVRQAIAEDTAGNHARAFPLYMNALEYFKTHLKYEPDPTIREAISQKFTEYLRRAILDGGGSWTVRAQHGGDGDKKLSLDDKPKQEETWTEQSRIEHLSNFFREQAMDLVRQAVAEDNACNYAKAFPLYMNALEYFNSYLKYEKHPKIQEAVTQKFNEYLRRAEEIRAFLDEGGSIAETMPDSKRKVGGCNNDGGDAELISGLNSTIIRDKPKPKPKPKWTCWSCVN